MPNRLSAAKAILYGTLVAGTLDALDAIVFWARRAPTSRTDRSRVTRVMASGCISSS